MGDPIKKAPETPEERLERVRIEWLTMTREERLDRFRRMFPWDNTLNDQVIARIEKTLGKPDE